MTVAIIPAHNEEKTIFDVVEKVVLFVDRVVVVNDGSVDKTAILAKEAGAEVITHLINRGQGAALATGTSYALSCDADIIVHFDADGQHDPADIDKIIKPIKDNLADVVLGSRFLGSTINLPLSRKIVLKLGLVFTRFFSGLHLTDTNNGFRAFSRLAASSIKINQDGMAHASEILDQVAHYNFKYIEVPVTIRYTAETLRRGQRNSNAISIVRRLVVDKFFPH